MRGRNLRRTLVAAGLVAASAVLVLVLAVAGLLAFIANPPMCPTATPLPMWPPLPAGI